MKKYALKNLTYDEKNNHSTRPLKAKTLAEAKAEARLMAEKVPNCSFIEIWDCSKAKHEILCVWIPDRYVWIELAENC